MSASSTEQMGPEEVEAIGEAMGHPVRFRMATALEEEPGLTARQLADRTGEPPRKVRYQLRLLRDDGLVQISGQGQRRGAIEHHFSMARRLLLADEEYDALPVRTRGRVGLEVLRLIAADVAAASDEGILAARRGHAEIRFIGRVDQGGWEELARIQWRYFQETERILGLARRRIAKRAEAGIPVTIALLLFERAGQRQVATDWSPVPEFALVEALAAEHADPDLIRLAFLVGDDPGLTVRQMAERIDDTPRRVRYRLDELRRAGMVAVSGERPRRGTVEHRYSMVRPVVFSDDDLDRMDDPLKARIALEIFRNIAGDAAAAAREEMFGVRPGHTHVRRTGEVDDRGWEALAAMSDRFLATVQEVLDESGQRLSGAGRKGTPITSGLFLLERPSASG
jgi:DNA-binding transcriptional ArsR family regulator